MARNVVRHARSGSKRLSTWLGIGIGSTTLTASGGTLTNALNAAALALRPFTIVRTYMEFMVISDQAASVESQVCAFGMAVVSDQALAIGVTAVPTPVNEIESDLWFLHQVMFARQSNLLDTAIGPAHYSVDSKAMRRVDGDQDVAIVAEQSGTGSGLILFLGGCMLIKTN